MVPDLVDKASDVVAQLKHKDVSVDAAVADYMEKNGAEAAAKEE